MTTDLLEVDAGKLLSSSAQSSPGLITPRSRKVGIEPASSENCDEKLTIEAPANNLNDKWGELMVDLTVLNQNTEQEQSSKQKEKSQLDIPNTENKRKLSNHTLTENITTKRNIHRQNSSWQENQRINTKPSTMHH